MPGEAAEPFAGTCVAVGLIFQVLESFVLPSIYFAVILVLKRALLLLVVVVIFQLHHTRRGLVSVRYRVVFVWAFLPAVLVSLQFTENPLHVLFLYDPPLNQGLHKVVEVLALACVGECFTPVKVSRHLSIGGACAT